MPREVLHVALGSSACEVTAHLLNLYGLAATGDAADVDPTSDGASSSSLSFCQPHVTHTVHQELWVPRALLVDSGSAVTTTTTTETNVATTNDPLSSSFAMGGSALWSGNVAVVEGSTGVREKPAVWNEFWKASQALSSASFSRYRAPGLSQQASFPTYSLDQRAVNWDDLPEEEEEDEEDDWEREARRKREHGQWFSSTQPKLQANLDSFWSHSLGHPQSSSADEEKEHTTEPALEKESTQLDLAQIHWRDYLAPPYRDESILPFPLSPSNRTVESWNHYFPISQEQGHNTPGLLSTWAEDQLVDHVRRMLEACDSCQGMVLAESGHGVHAGLATQLLRYLSEECRAARTWVWSLEDEDIRHGVDAPDTTSRPPTRPDDNDEESWRSRRVRASRQAVERVLMWKDYTEWADLITPLHVRSDVSAFHASATVAATLEAATLPYRLRGGSASRVGLNSYYYGTFSGASPFGSADSLSFSELVANLKPTPKLSVVELDTVLPRTGRHDLWPRLLEGTSLERDQRMRHRPDLVGSRRPLDIEPGQWMLGDAQGGILSSYTPKVIDRRLHTHHALSAALRFEGGDGTVSDVVDCMLQGMGIRYRPEQSTATCLSQDLLHLTGAGYGAGSYWKYVWDQTPVLSLLSNSTRFFPQALEMVQGGKDALSHRNRGFLNRDVDASILPELDDCVEAVSSLYDLRDRYEPPHMDDYEHDDEI